MKNEIFILSGFRLFFFTPSLLISKWLVDSQSSSQRKRPRRRCVGERQTDRLYCETLCHRARLLKCLLSFTAMPIFAHRGARKLRGHSVLFFCDEPDVISHRILHFALAFAPSLVRCAPCAVALVQASGCRLALVRGTPVVSRSVRLSMPSETDHSLFFASLAHSLTPHEPRLTSHSPSRTLPGCRREQGPRPKKGQGGVAHLHLPRLQSKHQHTCKRTLLAPSHSSPPPHLQIQGPRKAAMRVHFESKHDKLPVPAEFLD